MGEDRSLSLHPHGEDGIAGLRQLQGLIGLPDAVPDPACRRPAYGFGGKTREFRFISGRLQAAA